MIIRSGAIYNRKINDAYIQNVTCPHCQSIVNATLCRDMQTVTILFIPFIRKTVSHYSTCNKCNIKYILSKKDYVHILRSENRCNDWNRICSSCFEKEKEKSLKRVMRSSKNIIVASLLSFIFGIFGIQNIYMGHKKRFLINISLILFSMIMFALALKIPNPIFLLLICTACIATNVYWGIIDFIRILSGHAKDSDNRYLLTSNQHKKILFKNLQLNEKTYIYPTY